jgi:microcystin-dependent protein
MSAYNPPIEDLPIFDTNAFTNANEGNGALVSEYLKFPIAQGLETFPNGAIVNNNLQNSYLSAIVGSGPFYIDGDTSGGDIYITAKTSTSKTIIQTENLGVAIVCATFENGGITGDLTGISSKLLLATKDDNVEYNVPFTSAVAGGGSDFFIDGGLNVKYNPSTNNLTVPNMIVSSNIQNSFLSGIVGGGSMFIDSDTAGGDIVITNKTVGSKTIIRTEGAGGILTNSAVFENGTITGNLTGTSSAITVTSDNNAGTYYVPFVKTSGTGSKDLFMDDVTGPLTYNPSTATLTTSNFVGNISITTSSTNATHYPTFIGTGSGNRALLVDGDYGYNPNTNTLIVRNIIGVSLSVTSNSGSDLRIATTSTGNRIDFNNTATTGNICYMDSTGLTMATGKIITGNVTGTSSNASAITITSDDTTGNYYIPFTKTSGTGSRTLFMDDTLPALTYSPNNNLLTVRNIEGTTLTAITDFDMTIATTTGAKKIYFNNTGTTGNICYIDSTGLTMASGKIFTGDLTGIASKSKISLKTNDLYYSIPFTDNGGATSAEWYLDGNYNLEWNPFLDRLKIPSLDVGGIHHSTAGLIFYLPIDNVNNVYYTFNIDDLSGNPTQKFSISPTEIKAGTGVKFIGDLTGIASSSTNIRDGFTGNLVYQSLPSTTGFISNGNVGEVLISNGSSAPYWGSTVTVSTAVNAQNVNISFSNVDDTFLIPFVKNDGDTTQKKIFMDNTSHILTYNPFTGILTTNTFSGTTFSGTTFTGTTFSGQANKVLVTPNSNDINLNIVFTDTNGNIYRDSSDNIIYNPSTNLLSGMTISGKYVINNDDTDGTYHIPFAKTDVSGNKTLFIDNTTTPLTYNPFTSNLTCSTFTGQASNVLVTPNVNSVNFNMIFTDTSGNIYRDGENNILYNPFTNVLSGAVFSGQYVLNNDDTAGSYHIPFAKTEVTGNKTLCIDNTTTPLTYNPSTSNLTCSTFTGALSGNANSATLATNLTTTSIDIDKLHYFIFTDNENTNNSTPIFKTSGIYCNPSTDTVNASIFSGTTFNSTNISFSGTLNSVSATIYGYISTLSSSAQQQLTDLQTKTQNQTATTTTTTFNNISFTGTLNTISTTVYGYLSGMSENINDAITSLKSRVTTLETANNNLHPTGSIIQSVNGANGIYEPNFLLCDGRDVSRITYSALFTIIGTNYGWNGNASQFRLPDFRGVFLRGMGSVSRLSITYSSATNAYDFQQDAIQTHNHIGQSGSYLGTNTSVTDSGWSVPGNRPNSFDFGITGIPTSSARTATNTYPANFGIYYYIKT